MAVNKVVYDNNTLIDLTNDTVTPQTLAAGTTAHAADGSVITGVAPTTAVLYTAQTLSSAQQQQARDNIGIDVVSAHGRHYIGSIYPSILRKRELLCKSTVLKLIMTAVIALLVFGKNNLIALINVR